jgi:leader peptidase (prepilin peptidase)/N-methyltransferase
MIPAAAALFGAIIGSFLNVVILRRGVRSLGGRSSCTSCARPLEWYELVPVLSWLALAGQCRTCGSGISWQYPAVEALTAILFAFIAAAPLPFTYQMSAALVACLSIVIAVYDIRHTIIPDEWVILLSMSALMFSWAVGAFSFSPWEALLAGPFAALPFFLLWLVSGGRWMGLGDAKLALGIGWFLGILDGFRAIVLAFMLGAIVSVCILLPLPYLIHALRRFGAHASVRAFTMKSEVPFGPFLLAAMWIVWLAGAYGFELPILNI